MLCRTGKNFTGKWSAPAMYTIGGVSAGLQVGGSSTDYVLLVVSQKGVDALILVQISSAVVSAAGKKKAESL
jgi:lipid-binding SYLF domain-containing protein